MDKKMGSQEASILLRVSGITCMDCAAQFQRAVTELPGVTEVQFNALTGRLAVSGRVDLLAIRRAGRVENYTISNWEERTQQPKGISLEVKRVSIAAVALVTGYLLEKFGLPTTGYIGFYLLAMVVGGWASFRKAAVALVHGKFTMNVLMAVAVVGAIVIGQWEEGATVAFLFAVSELLEGWTMDRARRSVQGLMDLAPRTAVVRRADGEQTVAVEEVQIGDQMILRPGEKIAMDGVIIAGRSAINQATITGESLPVDRVAGDLVYAGTLNTSGSLEIEVTKLVQDTTIAKIISMVEDAQARRAPAQVLVDRFAAYYTPAVIALAFAIAVLPPLFSTAEWTPWFYRGLALLLVACPCALVVSTPVAVVAAISSAARQGVLIKGGAYLEAMASLTTVAFDKTGTLTKGEPTVTDVMPLGSVTTEKLLWLAAALESRSEHPLARAVIKEAAAQAVTVQPVKNYQALSGRGGQGEIQGETFYIGSMPMFSGFGMDTTTASLVCDQLQSQGKTVILIGTQEALWGVIAVADTLRESSRLALAELRAAGILHTIMLTGDNETTAQAVAGLSGIDEYLADLLPGDKVAAIETLKSKYGGVAMVGDGINDAPALAAASIGIAMGGAGTDTALETADIILMADDLTHLPFTVRLSRATLQIIRQNISLALGIKLLAVLAVFPGWLTLWLAIVADMGATLLVTLNSMRLLRVKDGK